MRIGMSTIAGVLFLTSTGCTYLQNRVDDLGDIFIVGIGGTAARETPFPPALGLYAEATEFLHLGGMLYHGYMLEVDRRGASVTEVEEDTRWAIGPFHKWCRDESCLVGNGYKEGEMPGWEERMERKAIESPVFEGPLDARLKRVPAKRMRYVEAELGPFPRGWQDWGFIGLDAALSEPFLLHAGIRAKLGVDISQVVDFVVGVFYLDLYGDDATEAEYRGLYESPAGDSRADQHPRAAARYE